MAVSSAGVLPGSASADGPYSVRRLIRGSAFMTRSPRDDLRGLCGRMLALGRYSGLRHAQASLIFHMVVDSIPRSHDAVAAVVAAVFDSTVVSVVWLLLLLWLLLL